MTLNWISLSTKKNTLTRFTKKLIKSDSMTEQKPENRYCLLEYRPFYYPRYVDDIFVLLDSPEPVKRFQSYLNSRHVNISFTKNERDKRMPFLDVNIIRE